MAETNRIRSGRAIAERIRESCFVAGGDIREESECGTLQVHEYKDYCVLSTGSAEAIRESCFVANIEERECGTLLNARRFL